MKFLLYFLCLLFCSRIVLAKIDCNLDKSVKAMSHDELKKTYQSCLDIQSTPALAIMLTSSAVGGWLLAESTIFPVYITASEWNFLYTTPAGLAIERKKEAIYASVVVASSTLFSYATITYRKIQKKFYITLFKKTGNKKTDSIVEQLMRRIKALEKEGLSRGIGSYELRGIPNSVAEEIMP